MFYVNRSTYWGILEIRTVFIENNLWQKGTCMICFKYIYRITILLISFFSVYILYKWFLFWFGTTCPNKTFFMNPFDYL